MQLEQSASSFLKGIDGGHHDTLLDQVISQVPVVLFATDTSGNLTLSQGKGLAALGLTQHELVGTSIFELYRDEPEFAASARRALEGETVKSQLTLDGLTYETCFSPMTDPSGEVLGLSGMAIDVTEWVTVEQELRRRALFDSITALPNRNMLHDHVEAAMTGEPKHPFAIVAIGINHFHEVNSTFGFQYGDVVLRQIGEHLIQQFPSDAMVSRIGGDEFAVMVPANNSEELINRAVKKATAAFEMPFYVEDNAIALEAGIGVAIYPGHGSNADMLLRRAGSAMQASKVSGSNYTFYKPARDDIRINNVALLAELRKAVECEELFLQYQPKVHMQTGDIVGVEALLRWKHPQRGLVSPGEFIPLAERTGIIRPLTQWVANAAACQIVRWRENGYHIPVAINLSSRSFQSESLVEQLESLLEVWGIDGPLLELEITETAVMTDPDRAIHVCRRAREMGIAIAIDDFGVGHSPLAYLKKLDASHIKIDQTFIKDMNQNADNLAIVRSIVDLGKQLGLLTVGEGIEDLQTYQSLADLGCDHGQGFYIARPMDPEALMQWITDNTVGQ